MTTPVKIAARFVEARLAAEALAEYPGDVPLDLRTAYQCQDLAIDLWPDSMGGWKVARISTEMEGVYHADRLAGPIFNKSIRVIGNGEVAEMPVFVGGFAAVEAEYVTVIGSDAPADKTEWSLDEAAAMIRDLRIGIEMAGSPLRTVSDLGPASVVSDFGNNAGLVVGGSIRDWNERELESLRSESFIDGQSVGSGGAFRLTGGPVRSVQFILELAARRGRPLREGTFVATGQTTGVHKILPGQSARIVFGDDGELRCKVVPAIRGQ